MIADCAEELSSESGNGSVVDWDIEKLLGKTDTLHQRPELGNDTGML